MNKPSHQGIIAASPHAPDAPTVKPLRLSLVLAITLMAPATTLFAAGPAPVNLGSTAHFGILAGAAITTTGGGAIHGDVGASPIAGSAIGIPAAQVIGTIYEVDDSGPAGAVVAPALLTAAKGDLTTAYNDAAGRSPAPSGPFLDPGNGNIGGLTLGPGLYKFTGTASISGANVTLTGGPDDVWIFQIAADLEEASSVQVILAGGAQARNIFWQVGTSVTIGTSAVFQGTILAYQAVTMNTSSSMTGRLLAFNAGVTFNGTINALPTPAAPVFTSILKARSSPTTTNSVTVVLTTTPYFPVTLQSSPRLVPATWTTIATNYPATSPWTVTDTNILSSRTQNFYRAFITTPQ